MDIFRDVDYAEKFKATAEALQTLWDSHKELIGRVQELERRIEELEESSANN